MRSILVLIPVAIGLCGCAVTGVNGERMALRSDAFSAYIEVVFRRQNDIATELAFAIDDAAFGSERYVLLDMAELELQEACRGLNQLARAQRNGDSVGGLGALKQARGAPDCERAAEAAASLLQELNSHPT